jgi:hypothetical protein
MDTAHASYDIYAHDNHINSNQGDGSHGNHGSHRNSDKAHGGHGNGDRDASEDLRNNVSSAYCPKDNTPYAIDDGVKQYWCSKPVLVNGSLLGGEYNEGTYKYIFTILLLTKMLNMFICSQQADAGFVTV